MICTSRPAVWCSRGCTAVTALLIAARGAQPQAIAPQSNGVECSRERWNAEQSDYPTMHPLHAAIPDDDANVTAGTHGPCHVAERILKVNVEAEHLTCA